MPFKPSNPIFSLELSQIGFKNGSGVPTARRKIQKNKPINLAPSFLIFFSLSIPLFAWLFIRDEETILINGETSEENDLSGELLEVDFSKEKREKKEDLKKAS